MPFHNKINYYLSVSPLISPSVFRNHWFAHFLFCPMNAMAAVGRGGEGREGERGRGGEGDIVLRNIQ